MWAATIWRLSFEGINCTNHQLASLEIQCFHRDMMCLNLINGSHKDYLDVREITSYILVALFLSSDHRDYTKIILINLCDG